MPTLQESLPVIDIQELIDRAPGQNRVARELDRACRETGFFYIVGHGIDTNLTTRLEELGRLFFALDDRAKCSIGMERGGRAWRGYFPLGAEQTSGSPDMKEGLYLGAELAEDHPRVRAGVPLHGRNLFPTEIPELRTVVLEYIDQMTLLGHTIMEGVAQGLGLDRHWFRKHLTASPLTLFRIFNYPPTQAIPQKEKRWSVAEHTDYGLLTILHQDMNGGLEVKSDSRWISAPPIPGSLVCNIGDMLDRMTGGVYRSTPHRVINAGDRDRISFPFFFDPDFESDVICIDHVQSVDDDRAARWDKESVHDFTGTYGEYLMKKIKRVFPDLFRNTIPPATDA